MGLNFQGALNYVIEEDQKKLLEQKRQDAKEQTALSLMGKYSSGSLGNLTGTKQGKAAAPTSSVTANSLYLKDNYNLSDEVLAPIIASGDKTALPRLTEFLDKQRLKFEAVGKELPEEVVNELIETAIVEQPTTKPIDYTEIEKFIGREMGPLYKSIIGTETVTPGSVIFKEPAFVENPDIEDLERFEKVAVKQNFVRAQMELELLVKRQAELKSITDNTALNTAQEDERDWITGRLVKVNGALDSYKKENIVPIVQIYGNTYADALLEAYPTYKNMPYNPILVEASAAPMTVPNRGVAKSLANSGILKDGDVVLNLETGRKIRIGD
jgi:hypothetical protein